MIAITAARISGSVRQSMRTAGVSAGQIAAALALSSSATHRRLSGEVEFRPSELVAIAHLLNTTAADLVGADDERAAA